MIKYLILFIFLSYCIALEANNDESNHFENVDKNNDGFISLAEFLNWKSHGKRSKNINLFKSYDINGDEHLSVSEFVPLVYALSKSPTSEAEKLFKLLDSNNDEVLSKDEVYNSKENIPVEIASGLFQVADINNDGSITYDEFISVVDSASHVDQSKNHGTAQSLLNSIDVNSDKKASKKEVKIFATRFNQISDLEIDNVFRLLDNNHDSYLSLEELEKLPGKITELAGIRPMPILNN